MDKNEPLLGWLSDFAERPEGDVIANVLLIGGGLLSGLAAGEIAHRVPNYGYRRDVLFTRGLTGLGTASTGYALKRSGAARGDVPWFTPAVLLGSFVIGWLGGYRHHEPTRRWERRHPSAKQPGRTR